jgi:hypothetical protein
MEAGTADTNTYFDRVLKYIPADVVAAWIFISGVIATATAGPTETVLWIVFVIVTILTALWTWRQTEPELGPATTQIVIATIAFVVWVFALGGPFQALPFYQPWIGSVVLVLFTLAVGAIEPRE